ncbi:MAG: putative quinol monooxygenase [Verrucomicrobiales bacterium]
MKIAASLVAMALTTAAYAQTADPLAELRAQVKNPDSMFTVIVEFRLKPGSDKEFRKAAQEGVRNTRKEPGNAAYEVHQDAKDPSTFVFFEKWRSMKALEEHIATPYTKNLMAKAAELSASPMTIRVLTPFVPQPPKPGVGKPAPGAPDTKPAESKDAAPKN